MINLEVVLLQETKVWELFTLILENQSYHNLIPLCEDWWEITKDATSLFDIYKIYRDPLTRKSIRKAMILECIVILLSAYLAQIEHPSKLQKSLKKLY